MSVQWKPLGECPKDGAFFQMCDYDFTNVEVVRWVDSGWQGEFFDKHGELVMEGSWWAPARLER